jgi:hypothetical protein
MLFVPQLNRVRATTYGTKIAQEREPAASNGDNSY